MGTWLSPKDVLDRWTVGNAPQESSRVLTTVIEDVEDAAIAAVPNLNESLAENKIPLNRVKRILAGAVIRHYTTGHEYRVNYSETYGPASQSATIREGKARDLLLASEIEALSVGQRDETPRALTLDMASHAYAPHLPYDAHWGWEVR